MMDAKPIIVALPLREEESADILAVALELGKGLKREVVIVQALGDRFLESDEGLSEKRAETRQRLAPKLRPLREAGIDVREIIDGGEAADLVVASAQRLSAELIVTGGGRSATIRRWLMGSKAESIVRRAVVPVWVVRGTWSDTQPVLCPVDATPTSKLGLATAIHMAQLFELPLRVMTVVPEDEELDGTIATEARLRTEELLASFDTSGLSTEVLIESGSATHRIVEAADTAALLVVGSRGFDPLDPARLGQVTTRAIRHSQCSVLALREVDVNLQRNKQVVMTVAGSYHAAWDLLEDGESEEALVLIEPLAERAPFNALIQETYAIALERVGRVVEARGRHEIAKMIRDKVGPR